MSLTLPSVKLDFSSFTTKESRPSGVKEDAAIEPETAVEVVIEGMGNKGAITSADVTVEVGSAWMLKQFKDARDADLLKHEQGHLDIHSIGARELYNRLLKVTGANERKIMHAKNQLEAEIKKATQRVQDRYDSQTQHGTNSGKQGTWSTMINTTLLNTQGKLKDLP